MVQNPEALRARFPAIGDKLAKASALGFPQLEHPCCGRDFAVAVASGETFASVGAAAGLTRQRVRQKVWSYLQIVLKAAPSAGTVCAGGTSPGPEVVTDDTETYTS